RNLPGFGHGAPSRVMQNSTRKAWAARLPIGSDPAKGSRPRPGRPEVRSAWRKRRVSAPFYSLFCWLLSVLYRRPIFVGAADIFSFILAPLLGPIFRMIHVQLTADDS